MKGMLFLMVLLIALIVSPMFSLAKEISLGEKRISGDGNAVLSVEYREMKNKFCHLKIEYSEDGKLILSDHVNFYAYEGEFHMIVDGKKLIIFHTEVAGGTITAMIDGKEI